MSNRARINQGFWSERLAVNAQKAIFHQWEQLEASGCIKNFRITAGESEGLRTGWFFADSDAYKWLDAASRIWVDFSDPRLVTLMDSFISLLARAQMPDGYLFTYNQVYFPGVRWQNLQIEHELYCHGHLIEAGVSHFEATGRTDLLDLARRAADRIVDDFSDKDPSYTPGHEEIEIALLRLHHLTPGDSRYLEMARQFIDRRGKTNLFGWSILRQQISSGRRSRFVENQKQKYLADHPAYKPFYLPPGNPARSSTLIKLRWFASALNGKYFQQHEPFRKQTKAEGHSVRFAYLQTAAAMLAREAPDRSLLPALERTWESMVLRRMYVTGGIGSLPELEGFGNDNELDDESAYAETCAALGSLFWNREMAALTGSARYSDLYEWTLYNAAAVGMGIDGTSYFYNNPLACRTGITRRPWYAIPCCPSNLSRTFADLGKDIYSVEQNKIVVHQYISNVWPAGDVQTEGGQKPAFKLEMESGFPWQGDVKLRIIPETDKPLQLELLLRQPSWAGRMTVKLNGRSTEEFQPVTPVDGEAPASGVDPRRSVFRTINHDWSAGDELEIHFELGLTLRRASPRVRGHQGKVALTRGPLVYCLESVDNPGIDIFSIHIEPSSLTAVFDETLLGWAIKIEGKSTAGDPLTFIPYFLWGNRGASQMTVWVNE